MFAVDASLPPIEAQAEEAGAYAFRDENILGTRMQILLTARNYSDALAAAQSARAEIDRLNAILNERDPHSEISRLNRSTRHNASPELFEVISAAERWRKETGGAFSGRLGSLIGAWQSVGMPSRDNCLRMGSAAESATVLLDSATCCIERPVEVTFALEGFAKGWIVDRAYEMARAAPGVSGALIDIGGDIRCGGSSPECGGWRVGLPDPMLPFDNAPLVAVVAATRAIATSGVGPRDRVIDGERFSHTLSPQTGWPVAHHLYATVEADTAADADALATAMLVLPTERGVELAERFGAAARVTHADGKVVSTAGIREMRLASTTPSSPTSNSWHTDWQALATFTAPRRQLIRDPDFRSPYMAMWITDLNNRTVRTLLLVGKRAAWQKDNFIWWSMNRDTTDRLVSTRSVSTSNAGMYNVFWDGVDDAGQPVAPGEYVLHVETSRERGKHTYRSLVVDFTQAKRFETVLPPTEEGGGLRVTFDHY